MNGLLNLYMWKVELWQAKIIDAGFTFLALLKCNIKELYKYPVHLVHVVAQCSTTAGSGMLDSELGQGYPSTYKLMYISYNAW